MSKITLTKDEVYEAYEDGKVVETSPWRWGTRKSVVFEREGKNFLIEVECHSQEGLQVFDGMEAVEVRPEERRTTVWVPV